MLRKTTMTKYPAWLAERIAKENWAKKVEGIIVERRTALDVLTNRNVTKYFKRSYSLKIPRIRKYKFWFLNMQLFRYNYNGMTKTWQHVGLIPNVINFGISNMPNMLLWLSMRHPLMSEFELTISKEVQPLSDKEALKLLKSGKCYPYALEFRKSDIAIKL